MHRTPEIALPSFALLLILALGFLLPGNTPAQEPDEYKAAVGSSLYRAYCGSCHGKSAVGDGDVAQYLEPKPADLTKIAERNGGKFDVTLVAQIIEGKEKVKGHGRGDMPVWGDALLIASGGATEEEAREKIEQLAQYLWTIQK